MKILLSWLHEMLPTKPSAEEVAKALTSVGVEVTDIQHLAKGFEKVSVARIESMRPHSNADRLTLCKVFEGSQTLDIVCGAKNMKEGDYVALAHEGAHLPNGLTIKKGKIRGENSEGMLCSESELGLSEESEGILILSKENLVGTALADVLGRNDWLLELEIGPNRGDCLSIMGVAREAAAALKITPKLPLAQGEGPKESSLRVNVLDRDGAPRFTIRALEGIKVKPSSDLIRRRLETCGIRSINNVVDVTNYVSLEWGQPEHAFDAAKIVGGLQVRRAKKGEKILCLDGEERVLADEDIVIADDEGPIGIAGVMGGARTAVSESTTSIWLETAHFSPSAIRQTSKRLNLHTEASHRFERSVDPAATWAASSRAVALLLQQAGGKEEGSVDIRAKPISPRHIVLRKETLRRITGVTIAEAGEPLSQIGLPVEKLEEGWKVEIPPRRPDLEREVDLVEEVARIYGYDKIPAAIPSLMSEPEGGSLFEQVDSIKNALSSAGLREVRGYSFVGEEDGGFALSSLGKRVRIENPLSSEMTFMRQSLFPSLLKAWNVSRSHQAKGARLYEIGHLYGAGEGMNDSPAKEELHLAAFVAGEMEGQEWYRKERTAQFFDLRGVMEFLADQLRWGGVSFGGDASFPELHPAQSAAILWRNHPIGRMGVLHPRLARTWDVGNVILLDLHLDPLLEGEIPKVRYKPLSPFPRVERDLAFILPKSTSAEKIPAEIQKLKDPLLRSVKLFDLYEGKGIPSGEKSLAYRLTFGLPDRTLTDAEIDASVKKMVDTITKSTGAKLRA